MAIPRRIYNLFFLLSQKVSIIKTIKIFQSCHVVMDLLAHTHKTKKKKGKRRQSLIAEDFHLVTRNWESKSMKPTQISIKIYLKF